MGTGKRQVRDRVGENPSLFDLRRRQMRLMHEVHGQCEPCLWVDSDPAQVAAPPNRRGQLTRRLQCQPGNLRSAGPGVSQATSTFVESGEKARACGFVPIAIDFFGS